MHHQELIQKETPNSPLGNGLDKDGTYTTSTSDGTVVTYDELTKTWETLLIVLIILIQIIEKILG